MKKIYANKYIKLNRQEFQYLAFENFVPSMGMITTLRFRTKHSSHEIRDAMRHMLLIYPKLRTFIKPTVFGYKFRILEDNNKLDLLFDDAFAVVHDIIYDSEEYLIYRRELLNKPFSLKNELPIRVRYFPDGKYSILLFCIHHIILDGGSWHHLLNSLISHLNGEKTSIVPLYSPRLATFLLKRPLLKVPQQILKSYKFFRKDAREIKDANIINISKQSSHKFGPIDLYQNELYKDINSIRSRLRESGYSLSVLIISAISLTAAHSLRIKQKNNLISILVSVNLRPYFRDNKFIFGNYVVPLMIHVFQRHLDNPFLLLKEISSQLKGKLNRIKKKEDLFRFFIGRTLTFIGEKNYARIIKLVFINNKVAFPLTFQFSNLGSLDSLNSHGNKAQVYEAIPISPSLTPFFTVSSLGGRLIYNYTYPKSDFSRVEIIQFSHILNKKFEEVVNLL